MEKNPLKLVTVFYFTGKEQDRLLKVSQAEFYVCLKCFEVIRVNICMVNRWFTVVNPGADPAQNLTGFTGVPK